MKSYQKKKQIIRQPTKKDLPNVNNNFGESDVLETQVADDLKDDSDDELRGKGISFQ